MTHRTPSFRQKLVFGLAFVALMLGLSFIWPQQRASAEYVEYNLIDDQLFLDAASMSQESIQTFLQARGAYIASYSPYSGRDGRTVPASQIIYEAAQDYGISPKVLLATMQKEQSLVTAKNPTQKQLDRAMGYGCPDSTGCQEKYYGFYNQVDNASWQLRYNFERARGNNTWWRNSSSYACGTTTHYYSTGLYVGRNVTFYDDGGAAYKSFTLNNAATASLYCYTPHAYPGSNSYYYSGSYNFVTAYEQWFGSTQPTVVISSPLRVNTLREGMFTGQPINLSFDIRNNTAGTIDLGSMMIAVRDSNGNNYDFGLKPMTIGPWGGATYSETTYLPAEGTYTFWITNYSGGQWRDGYPVSSLIDNARRVNNQAVRAMPTITQQPTLGDVSLRAGKSTSVTFKVKNNSAQAMNIGSVGLAVRGPSGENRDLPFDNISSLAAGDTYTYTKMFTPHRDGTFRMYISATKDNGATWNESSYPALASGIQRSISSVAKPNPTLTTSVSVAGGTSNVRVGQKSAITFQIKNHGDTPVTVGQVGVAVRDPQGMNRDPLWDSVTIAPDTTYTYATDVTFNKPGNWTIKLTNYRADLDWNTWFPLSEDSAIARQLSVQVKDNPTVTVSPTITPAFPRVGQAATLSYTVTNGSNQPAVMSLQGLAVRDPKQRNMDTGWESVTIPANSTYVYSKQIVFQDAGKGYAWLSGFRNGEWTNNYPLSENGAINRLIEITVLPSPTLITGLQASPALANGQTSTLTFSVKNFGDSPVNTGLLGLSIRDPQGVNRDPRWDAVTIAPGATYTYSVNVAFDKPGKWNITITNYQDSKGWNTIYPVNESNGITRTLSPTL